MSRLLYQNSFWALWMGSVLALYSSLTTFLRMSYGIWLAFHNLLIVASLMLAALIGYRQREAGLSFKSMLLSITIFFTILMLLYIGSYVLTTTFFAEEMVWIPFFYQDYTYHKFQSVNGYLSHENKERELLKLQVFSIFLSSGMYFAAGGLGYGTKALLYGNSHRHHERI